MRCVYDVHILFNFAAYMVAFLSLISGVLSLVSLKGCFSLHGLYWAGAWRVALFSL